MDLLGKLKHDLKRIRQNPLDPYAAFDFFVTAEHLPEWCGKAAIRREHALLRVVSHLASGAKHFQANDPKHRSVNDVGMRRGGFDPRAFSSAAFDTGGLFIELTGDDAQTLGSPLEVYPLAEQVLKFWEERLAS